MTARLIDLDTGTVREVSDPQFFEAFFGHPPKSRADQAEAEARRAKLKLAETIRRVEYAKARREREELIRDAIRNGTGDYDEYLARINAPFERAAERVRARLAEIEQRRAA